MKGHKESQCLKKSPKKVPEWWTEKNAKAESVLPSVEATLMSFGNPVSNGVEAMALSGEKCDILAILHQENVWICNTGASTHVTWSNKDAMNAHDTQVLSLRYMGETIESTAMLSIHGVVMNKNGDKGM